MPLRFGLEKGEGRLGINFRGARRRLRRIGSFSLNNIRVTARYY